MKKRKVTLPVLLSIAATRGMMGVGAGLLMAKRACGRSSPAGAGSTRHGSVLSHRDGIAG